MFTAFKIGIAAVIIAFAFMAFRQEAGACRVRHGFAACVNYGDCLFLHPVSRCSHNGTICAEHYFCGADFMAVFPALFLY